MTGKQINELESASSFNESDLMLIRKSAQGVDRKITYQDLIASIGNSAIDGYVATSSESNKITLVPANNAPVYQYFNGMKVSFVSPIASTGVVEVQIGSLPFKNLYAYKTTTSVVLENQDYIEAVYINGDFQQVNNAQYIYTNDYKVVLVEKNEPANFTDIYLETAFGVSKPNYYDGMSVNFLCTEDTIGNTRISIDGLNLKDVLENSGDYLDLIYNPLFSGQIVRLIYDGQSFIKDRFRNDNPKIEIPVLPNPSFNPELPIEEESNNPILIPVQNEFEFTVGTGGKFPNLQVAFKTLLNDRDFGESGNGKKVTLKIVSDLLVTTSAIIFESKNLSWITLEGAGNQINCVFSTDANYSTFFYFRKHTKGFRIKENTNIVLSGSIPVGGSSEGTGFFRCYESSEFFLKNVNITNYAMVSGVPNKSCIGQVSESFFKAESCNFIGGYNVFYFSFKSTVEFDNCKVNSWSGHGFYVGNSIGGGRFTVKNCDFSKAGVSSIDDIYLWDNLFGHTVIQSNSKAKSRLAPGTQNDPAHGTYIVTGSQDIQGTD